MRAFTHQTIVIFLALWMMLIIPVTASHHHHPNDPADTAPPAIMDSGASEAVTGIARETLNPISVPCLLCGRVLNPLLIENTGSGGIVPVTGKIAPSDPHRNSGKIDFHRLGDRSPPGSPVSF